MSVPAYRHLFGPVPSRRLGLSLGLDLNPVKVCSEDCVFCQIAPTSTLTSERKEWVPTEEVLAEWNHWRQNGGQADVITLSGSGEPTLHTRFGEILSALRADGAPRTALFTNGTLLHLPEVREAAAKADLVKATLSAADEETFQRIHRPAPGLTLEKLFTGIQQFRREYTGTLWLEVMLLPGYNDAPGQIRAIAGRAASLRPDAIHLNTATRPPMAGIPLAPLSGEALLAAAACFTPPAEIPARQAAFDFRAMPDANLLGMLSRHSIPFSILQQAYSSAPGELDARLQRLHLRIAEHNGVPTVFPPAP